MGGSSTGAGGASKAGTTIQNGATEPWGPAQGNLKFGLKEAGKIYHDPNEGAPYTGNVLAPVNPGLNNAWNTMQSLTAGGPKNLGAANAAVGGLLGSDGYNDDMHSAAGYASEMAGGNDPVFQRVLNKRTQDAINAGATRFGSNYGSAAIGKNMAQGIADATDQTILDNQGTRLGAAGLLGQIGQGAQGNSMQARQIGLGAMPALDALKFGNIDRRMQLQNDIQDRAQTEKDNQIRIWEAQHNMRGNKLAQLNAFSSGAGQLGGTSSALSIAKPAKVPWYQQAAAGAGLLGKLL